MPDYQLWLISYGSFHYRHRKHWRYGEGDRECFLVRQSSPRFAGIVAVLAQHDAVGPPQSIVLERARKDALGVTRKAAAASHTVMSWAHSKASKCWSSYRVTRRM